MKLKTYFVKLGFGRGTRKLCFCGWCLGKILINFETDFKTIFVVAAAQLINCVLKYFKLQCLLGMYSGSFNNALLFSFLRFAILLRRLVLLFFFFLSKFCYTKSIKKDPAQIHRIFSWICEFTAKYAQSSLGKSYDYTTSFGVDGIYF